MTNHLTDEEFAELLSGEAPARARAHMMECAGCRLELENTSEAISSFKLGSLQWAREQPAASRSSKPGILLGFPAMQTAAAMLLAGAVLGGGLILSRMHNETIHAEGAAVAASSPEPAGLAADNRLLLNIDEELSAQEPSPQKLYGIAGDGGKRAVADTEQD